jgi:uracil-DNA glycosylase
VPTGQQPPPSLRNVFRELQRDLGLPSPQSGQLAAWARQGVLLLNTTLTVEKAHPAAHAGKGWEALTDDIIQCLAYESSPKVFMLWGNHAQSKARLVAVDGGHCMLQSNHPSPLSATRGPTPFVGNGHFGAANRFLVDRGAAPIDWRID